MSATRHTLAGQSHRTACSSRKQQHEYSTEVGDSAKLPRIAEAAFRQSRASTGPQCRYQCCSWGCGASTDGFKSLDGRRPGPCCHVAFRAVRRSFSLTDILCRMHRIALNLRSRAAQAPVSTDVGDRLGTPQGALQGDVSFSLPSARIFSAECVGKGRATAETGSGRLTHASWRPVRAGVPRERRPSGARASEPRGARGRHLEQRRASPVRVQRGPRTSRPA